MSSHKGVTKRPHFLTLWQPNFWIGSLNITLKVHFPEKSWQPIQQIYHYSQVLRLLAGLMVPPAFHIKSCACVPLLTPFKRRKKNMGENKSGCSKEKPST